MTTTERLEAIVFAKRDPEGFYISQVDLPHGPLFADTVGYFQERFLKERVCADLDSAFARAVEAAARVLPAIIGEASA